MTEPLTSAPILETERLILRGPVRSDLSEFTRFVTSSPRMKAQEETVSNEDAWFHFLTGIGHWQWHGFDFLHSFRVGGTFRLVVWGCLNTRTGPKLSWHGIFLKGPRATGTRLKLRKKFVFGPIKAMA